MYSLQILDFFSFLQGKKRNTMWKIEPRFEISNNVVYATSKASDQWLSGWVLDSRPRGRGFEPHRRHCVVVLEQDTFILA